jgi:hypothetical protein
MNLTLLRQTFAFRTWLGLALAQALLVSTLCLGSEAQPFEGIVQFEPRRTVVPLVYCQDLPGHCPRPQPYWTLSLLDSYVHVEWAKPLAFGVPGRPRALEILGQNIRPGQRVRLWGRGRALSDDWFVLESLEEIEILHD